MQKFEIKCDELTKERKRALVKNEVVAINKPLRAVIAVGGVWIFYYGTDVNVPSAVQSVGVVFAVIGIVAIVFAIFGQKFMEMSYFSKSAKRGCFPAEVSVGKGGMFVRRRDPKKGAGSTGVTSVSAERFFAFPEIGGIEDYGEYFKIKLSGGAAALFLFKKDFGKGDPEAFKSYMSDRHLRS